MPETKTHPVPSLAPAVLLLAALIAGPLHAAVDTEALEKKLAKVASYEHGDSRTALKDLEDMVTGASTDSDAAAEVAERLAAVLKDDEATDAGKAYVCRQLWMVGTAKEVPTLAKLLDDERLAHMARYALQRMEDPAAGKALRAALDRLDGELLVGVINSIGERQRDAKAFGKLAELLESDDSQVAVAAARALGKFGGPKPADVIADARSGAEGEFRRHLTDAYLRAAEGCQVEGAADIYEQLLSENGPVHVRLAAQRGLVAVQGADARGMLVTTAQDAGRERVLRVAALRHLQRLEGDGVTDAMVSLLDQVGPDLRPVALNALGARGDRAAEGAVAKLAKKDGSEAVRTAAVEALAPVGTADSVTLLAGIAADETGSLRQEARRSLARLRGDGVNGAILEAINDADQGRRVELVRALGERRAHESVGALLELAADDPAAAVRRQALSVVGRYGSAEALEPLADRVVEDSHGGVRNAAVEALVSVAERTDSRAKARRFVLKAHKDADGGGRVAAIGALGKLGGAEALKAVRDDVDHDAEPVRGAAIRALADWPDASALELLWVLSEEADERKHRRLALRGLIRLIGASDKPAEKKVELYRGAIDRADRPNEKKQAISALASVAHPEALKLAEELAEDSELEKEAKQAAKTLREKLEK